MFSWVFGLIDYIILESVPRSDQEHFNRLNQDCNGLHYYWMFSSIGEEHFNRLNKKSNRLPSQDNRLHYQSNQLQAVIIVFSIYTHLMFSLSMIRKTNLLMNLYNSQTSIFATWSFQKESEL